MRREIFENWHQPVLLSEQVGISSDGVSVHWEERSREGKVWKGMEGAEMGGEICFVGFRGGCRWLRTARTHIERY